MRENRCTTRNKKTPPRNPTREKFFRSLNRSSARFHLGSALIKRDSPNLFDFKAAASMENVSDLWVCAMNDTLAVRPVVK